MIEDFEKFPVTVMNLLEDYLANAIAPKLHINQDFMFNILNTIDCYAILGGVEEISEILKSYSFILRYIFYVEKNTRQSMRKFSI